MSSNTPKTPQAGQLGGNLPPPPPPDPLPTASKPKAPTMGTIEETYAGSKVFYIAFGGEPLPDWTGIRDASSRLLSDLCFRSLDPVAGQKSTLHRIKGLSKPYDRKQKLSEFQKNVWNHLKSYGLDTMGYLPDPKNSTQVKNVVLYHPRFTGDLEKSLALSRTFKSKFDIWDKKHDYEAKQFLMNSLSNGEKEGFETFHDDDDTFAGTWLKLIHYLVTTSSKTYDDMKTAIRNLRPQQYPGQNIEDMAGKMILMAREIDNAGYYTHGLTTNMVDSFLCASKDAKGTFHHFMNNLREKVSKKEQETVFMNMDEQNECFAKDKLTYRDVCRDAVKIYRELVEANMWEPSKLPKDRQAPAVAALTKAQVLNLIESVHAKSGGGEKKKRFDKGCFNCGETNHQVKDCPRPKASIEQLKSRRHRSMAKWKLVAPKGNEAQTKTVNGRTFHWCQKCGNWTTTHSTATHTGVSKFNNEKKKKESSGETNLAAWEPSAWVVHSCVEDKMISPLQLLIYIYIVISFGFLISPSTLSIELLTNVWNCIKDYVTVRRDTILSWLGPMLWFILGYTSCKVSYYCQCKNYHLIKDCGVHRSVKRKYKPWKPKLKMKSAIDHHLHRKYPLRLRNENRFNTRRSTPTVAERKLLSTYHTHTQSSCYYPPRRRSNIHVNNHRVRQHYRSTIPRYKPTGIPNNHSSPNLNLTLKQQRNLRSKIKSVFMLGASKESLKKIVSLSPSVFKNVLDSAGKSTSFPIIWDSGASICVTPDRKDFISYQTSTDIANVKGLGGKQSTVAGKGQVLWSMHDVNGILRHLKLTAYHLPSCKARLISTNSLLEEYEGESVVIDKTSLTLSGVQDDKSRAAIIAFNNPITRLPTTTAYRFNDASYPEAALCHTVNTVHESNLNLNEAQKELLRWHQRLGHLAFRKIQHLLRTGVLSHTEGTRSLHTAASKIVIMPKCAACLFGKQTVRPSPGRTTAVVRDRAGILRAGNLFPGSEISVDHFISSVKGRLFQGYDKGSDDDRYVGGCIFVDHASSYIHVEFQPSLSTHETLRAKLSFEQSCRDVGIVPQKYMSDNGKSFTSRDFTDHLQEFSQIAKLAGVGAHHHNAQAERAIRTIMSISRTMMIHAGIHWPDMAKASLWPMAVAQACYLFNHVPSAQTGLSPADIFTKTRWPHKKFHDMHVWGCPVYVLDKALQDGKKIPKWRPRSHRSVYMGVSTSHASSVPLVLNPSTGSITPQFHVVFDDWFATVASVDGDGPDFTSKEWHKMFGESRYQYTVDDDDSIEGNEDAQESAMSEVKANDISIRQENHSPPVPLPVVEPPTQLKNDIVGKSVSVSPSDNSTTIVNQPSSTPVQQPLPTQQKSVVESSPILSPPQQASSPKRQTTQRKFETTTRQLRSNSTIQSRPK